MSGTGIGARSPCRTLKLNPMHFVRCALFGAGMARAAAASAPIFVLNSLDANVSIVDPAS